MKKIALILGAVFLFPALVMGGEKETAYLVEKMIPLAQAFLQRIGQTNNPPIGTNQIRNYKVDYFDDRAGCQASMRLTNDYVFRFVTETNKDVVRGFQRLIKTSYNLAGAPKPKVDAVKALNLQNKLNNESALVLAKFFFKRLGHTEENFYSPEINQCSWSGGDDGRGGKLPYYEVSWYRKDVKMSDVEKGLTNLPQVLITVSGTDASLLYYSRLYLPFDGDF